MKRLFYPLLIVFFLNVSASFKVSDDDESPTFWMYCDDKVFTYLELYSAYGAFHMHHQSSLGNFDTKGTFKLVDGALTLNLSNKKTEKYLLKDMTISPFPGQALAYTDFQPLIPTKRMNVKDAFKECGVQRLQKRKTGQK
jgi:hypothetical protein